MCMCLQLCVAVYMRNVCIELARCILLPFFLYIMKLHVIVLSYYKARSLIMYKKQWEQALKCFRIKTMQVGLVEKY